MYNSLPCFCLSCASFANWGATFILINIIWGVPAPHFGINKPKLHPFSKICTLFIHVFSFSHSRCRSTEGFVFLSETQTMLPSDTEGFRIRDWLIMKGNAGMGNAKTTIICLHYPQYHKWSGETHSDGTTYMYFTAVVKGKHEWWANWFSEIKLAGKHSVLISLSVSIVCSYFFFFLMYFCDDLGLDMIFQNFVKDNLSDEQVTLPSKRG